MLDLQMWGIPKEQRVKREKPYNLMPDGLYYFFPSEDVNYTFSIVHNDDWQTPLKIWTHDIFVGGDFRGNVPCLGSDCHMHAANNKYDNSLSQGTKPINKERPYPVKCKIIFPIMVDGVDQLLWYKMGQNTFETMLNYIVSGKKICVKKRGQREKTTYLFKTSSDSVDESKLSCLELPACDANYFIDAYRSSIKNEGKIEEKTNNNDYVLNSTVFVGKKISDLNDLELKSACDVMKQLENQEYKILEEEINKRSIPF